MPTINWAGTERARGEYMFHLQVGSHEDESIVLARHLARSASHVSVSCYDRRPSANATSNSCKPRPTTRRRHRGDASSRTAGRGRYAEVDERTRVRCRRDRLSRTRPLRAAVANALTARGWDGPRLMNTAGLRGYAPDFGAQSTVGSMSTCIRTHNSTLPPLCQRGPAASRRTRAGERLRSRPTRRGRSGTRSPATARASKKVSSK